ncbi:MAG: alpha-2-macroglobulin family protein [Porphyromonadaceae bacterium]|nr:alpha-2-macroglobulin family protein [Porphyromonadaceae bacterium]
MSRFVRYTALSLGLLALMGKPFEGQGQKQASKQAKTTAQSATAMKANVEYKNKVTTLVERIRKARRKDRPKDALCALGELEQLAEAQQSLGTLMHTIELREEVASRIDAEEARLTRVAAYERLSGLPGLTPTARALVRIHQLHYYLEVYGDVYYDLEQLRPTAEGADEVFPYKSIEGYRKKCLALLGEIESLAPLSATTAPYEPWAELNPLVLTRGGAWRGTLASDLFTGYDDDDGLIRSQMLALLERYIESAKTPSEQMHASWSRLDMLPKATADDYLAFLDRYEQMPEAFSYLRSALDRAYLDAKKRSARLYMAHLHRLMSLSYLSVEQKKRLKEREEELTSPSLYANLRYLVTVPSKRKTQIILSHAFVRNVVIEVFRLPQIVDRPEDWKPRAGDPPQWTKTFALEQDPEWHSKTDTLRLDLHRTGYYCLRLTSPEIKERQPILLHLPVTDRVAYQPPHAGEMGRIQWLDATTGAPVIDVPALSWESNWHRGELRRRDVRSHRTDALGFVTIAQGKEGRAGSRVVCLEDASDPIFASLRRWYEGAWGESYTAAMLTTDRAVYAEGQTLHLYGYLGRQARRVEEAQTLGGQTCQLIIYSPQGEEIKTAEVTTDSFGRFTLDYTLPRGILLGHYRAVCRWGDGQGEQATSFRVEAYQKPTFELHLTVPTEALRLGDSVQIPIEARELTGAALESVRLEVQTTVRRNRWWRWSLRQRTEELPLVQLMTDKEGQAMHALKLSPLSADEEDDAEEQGGHRWNDHYTYDISLRAIAPSGEVAHEQLRLSVGRELASVSLEMPSHIERTTLSGSLCFKSHTPQGREVSQRVAYDIVGYSDLERVLCSGEAVTNKPIDLKDLLRDLPSGRYTLRYRQAELSGPEDKGEQYIFRLYGVEDKALPSAEPLELFTLSTTYEGGASPAVFYGTALGNAYIYCQVRCDDELLPTRLLRPSSGQLCRLDLELGARKPERIGVLLYTAREGVVLQKTLDLTRQLPSRELDIEVRSFRDRTTPGATEEISVRISREGKPVRAALAAWMYDEALEQIAPLSVHPLRATPILPPAISQGYPLIRARDVEMLLSEYAMEGDFSASLYGASQEALMGSAAGVDMAEAAAASLQEVVVRGLAPMAMRSAKMVAPSAAHEARLAVRGDFAETAFFRPMLTTNAVGEAIWSYRVPDNLTRWRLCLLAHTEDLSAGYAQRSVEVYRPLMLKPYLPRLLRQGDEASLAATLRSEADKPLKGACVLELYEPRSERMLRRVDQPFSLAPKASTSLRFDLAQLPEGLDSVGVRLTAKAGAWSDGEQHLLPILPAVQPTVRSLSITHDGGLPLDLNLSPLYPSTGFIPEVGRIEVRLESHPLLLALEALPVLFEPNSEDAISLSAGLHAAAIRDRVLRLPGLASWLQERSEGQGGIRTDRDSLLATTTGQTPWSKLLKGDDEAGRRVLAYLQRDERTRAQEAEKLLGSLAKLQDEAGGWSWYPGMRPSPSLTLMMMRQLLHADGLRSPLLDSMLRKGWQALDAELVEQRKQVLDAECKHKTTVQIADGTLEQLYLIARSGHSPRGAARTAYDFFLDRLRSEVHSLPLYAKPRAALALAPRDRKLAGELLESLRQHLSSTGGGLYYANFGTRSYWWYNRLYTMQTETIAALAALAPQDHDTLGGLQRWLLGQKRGVRWESTLATSEAIAALTLASPPSDLTRVRTSRLELIDARGGVTTVEGERPSIVQGFSRESYPKTLKLSTSAEGQVWGVASARYSLPITEDTASGDVLRAVRHYYRRIEVEGKQQLVELHGGEALSVGDVLVVRLEITLDRAMDFVRLADPRLSCAEGREARSGYVYSPEARVSYYLEHRHEAINFYFDQLDRGQYLLEYEQSVVRSGVYQAPSAHLQSVYAPEYTASTGFGGRIRVEP